MNSAPRNRVVVVGGGITGLAAAHRLVELDPALSVTLLEADRRPGGVIETIRRDNFLIERSADNFIANVPWAVELCRRIGLADELIPTDPDRRGALVVYRGRLLSVPAGFVLMSPARIWPVIATPLLSPWGKLRVLAEYFVPRRREGGDESFADFACRRLGREAFERIVQPLVGGIYAADPEKLSIQSTMPRFVDIERRYGSLIRGARAAARRQTDEAEDTGARYGLFLTPQRGLSSLVEGLASRLPAGSVRLESSVVRIARSESGWTLCVARAGGEETEVTCDSVILAVPAPAASAMLAGLDPDLAADLARIEYAGTSIVSLALRRDQIARPLDAFGFVVPAREKRRVLAASFASIKFPGRAPDGMVLVRVFIGGACQSELADLDDEVLRTIAADELRELVGTRGGPLFLDVARWPKSMPQYHLGHGELVASIERKAARWPALALAGNAYHGVGIPACIHSGQQAAERILARLEEPRRACGEPSG